MLGTVHILFQGKGFFVLKFSCLKWQGPNQLPEEQGMQKEKENALPTAEPCLIC